jgi:HEAT repeat protein
VVRAAIASGDMYLDNDWTPEFKELRALLLSRMRGLPAGEPPETVPPDDAARAAHVEGFLATPDAPPDDDVTRAILDHCLLARCDFGDGDPLRWSPTVVEMFLLDFLPRKVALDTGQIRAMPDVLRRWAAFALERRGLERRWIGETQAAIEHFTPEFRQAVTDPSATGRRSAARG